MDDSLILKFKKIQYNLSEIIQILKPDINSSKTESSDFFNQYLILTGYDKSEAKLAIPHFNSKLDSILEFTKIIENLKSIHVQKKKYLVEEKDNKD